jgi:hypothetical protein
VHVKRRYRNVAIGSKHLIPTFLLLRGLSGMHSVPCGYASTEDYWPGCERERYAGAHGGGLLVGVEMMRPLLGSIHLYGFVLLSE